MVLRRIAGFFVPRLRKPIRCDCCGENFICGAGITGCWCTEIKLDAQTRAGMRDKFHDCLCRECLEKAAANQLL
jgi:hypothetical protein